MESSAMDGDDLVQEVALPLGRKCGIKPKGTCWLSKLCRGAARKKPKSWKKNRRGKEQSGSTAEERINKWKPDLPLLHPDLGLDPAKFAKHWGTQSWVDSKVTSFCV